MPSQDTTLQISVYARTDVGMVRAGNEDTFLVLNLNTADCWTPGTTENEPPDSLVNFPQGHYGSLLAVSDGMGGALAGEVASRMAVEGVRDRMLQFQAHDALSPFPFHERLRLAVEQANIHINNESMSNADYAGMGATFTAAGVYDCSLFLAQIGDSRCYLVRGGKIHLLTHDQSLVWQLVEAGHITEEEAETHQYKNVILQALGAQPRVNVVVDHVELHEGDVILLCSDGLSGRVRAEEMLSIIVESESLKEGCDRLIQLANDRGGDDNITVILARFSGEALPPAGGLDTERVERDPDLPYDVDVDTFSTDPDTTLPLGSKHGGTSAFGTPKVGAGNGVSRAADARPATDFNVTSVGMPALQLPPSPMTEGVDPPPPPPPPPPSVPTRAAPAQSRRSPVFGLLTAILILGAISVAAYVFKFQRATVTATPADTNQQPVVLPPRPPDPTSQALARAFALEKRLDDLEEEVKQFDKKRKKVAEDRLDVTEDKLDEAKRIIPTSPADAGVLLDQVDGELDAITRDFFPPTSAPVTPDGR